MRSNIILYDPSLNSDNIGDEVIYQACHNVVSSLFPKANLIRIATHTPTPYFFLPLIANADISFICGSNLLSSDLRKYNQWKLGRIEQHLIKRCISLGLGWWKYQEEPTQSTRATYNRIFSKTHLHSARDSYTLDKLSTCGIDSAINTSCPTTWNLTENHCSKIPSRKSDNAIFTITSYNQDIVCDTRFINALLAIYKKVFFWPQGTHDAKYFHSLQIKNGNSIQLIDANLKSFDNICREQSIEYVGTRLHGGIRALQNKIRTTIIAIDNRAIEMSKDINLPTILRNKESDDIKEYLNSEQLLKINIPIQNIQRWMSQFS